ncbi:hypothetical protein NBRC116188_17590 [Oceaniserpentilla sp. 4NH20-0058]|uniref:GGDEF domain-containing protein n=1 Tax=Oceaniserpentilla sp. 4NH20-0058 TaxID=3127660 RepID=UPI0031072C60
MEWLNLPKLNNRLTPEQKALFDSEIRKQQINSSRLFTIGILLLSLLFLIPDAYLFPEDFTKIASIRISIVLFCTIATLFIHRLSINHAYLVLAFSVFSYNLVVVYISVLLADKGIYAYQQGTVLLIIFCCTLCQAPFLLTVIMTTACWVSYLFSTALLSEPNISVIFNNTIIFIIASCLGLLSVAYREHYLLGYFISSQKLKAQEQQSKHQSLTDPLTELPNRLSIMAKIEKYAHLIPQDMIVMMADVDDFKKLNDQFGHKKGDIALKLIAYSLSETLKPKNGFVSRYGGEEFLIIIENTTRTEGQMIGEALVQSVKTIHHEELPKLSISIGGYLTTGNENSINDCIERADQTLLKAKAKGKECFLLNRREYSN